MMRNHLPRDSPWSITRMAAGLLLGAAAVALGVISFSPAAPMGRERLSLGITKLTVHSANRGAAIGSLAVAAPNLGVVLPPSTPTFGQPVISGIGGLGFEESLRLDPTNPDRIYTSAPGTLSAQTSWVWHSLDGGKTFKWVVGAAPLLGKFTDCSGGGDTELEVDQAGHLYFNDLSLANFSTARSDDFGVTLTCSNTGVPDVLVDRQWYASDGDPVNGGSLYLTNDEIGPGGVVCGTTPGNNVLAMYRSPVNGAGATAGITFGPANHVTPINSCDEGIMGNNEVSQVATTLGQPNGLGGYVTLATPVKHVYVLHDNALFNKILIGRCFPVAFGAPVANVSDPSGLNCTDLLVADLGPNQKTGGSFPTMAIDKAGNLYAVWEQAPIDANGNVTGDTVLKYAYSTNQGNTWSSPIQIDTSGSADGILHNNVFGWPAAGDDGRINIAWSGTTALSNPDDPTCGVNALVPPAQGKNINGPDSVNGLWSLWMVQSTNAHAASPTFTVPVRASGHPIHRGSVQTVIGGQCGSRALGDFFQLRTGAQGEAHLSYVDSNHIFGAAAGHAMYVRQNAGTGLYAASSPVNIPGIAPFNAVFDVSGDGKYEAGGTSSANMPQLDIIGSSVTKVTTPPCSVAAPCYKIVMQISDLSLAPTISQDPDQDPDQDLVWSTMWFVPSATDGNGGKNFHVYAESLNGAALQCFVGENALLSVSGGFVMTYPGRTQLPSANCESRLGPNGAITIYVPVASVDEAGAIDDRLHEVTASTMTLKQPANSNPDTLGVGLGGSLFNLIDVAPAYTFDPNDLRIISITRSNGHIILQCHGKPNAPNTIQFSPDLVTPFYFLASVVADANGDFQYEDTAPPPTKQFYRLALP